MLDQGRHEPLGATVRDGGVNFAIHCPNADAVELCLFPEDGRNRRLSLHGPVDGVFHGFLRGAGAGLLYGLRARGESIRDPYARALLPADADGWKSRVLADAGEAPACRNRPRLRDEELLLYELHVRGFSMQQQGIPEGLRGRYAALAHPSAIAHFGALGVNALLLLPVHLHGSDYWGYDALGLFVPEPRYAGDATRAGDEFREMTLALHAAGIEVLLDFSLRGLDLGVESDARRLLDALRFWVREMGVDGFRFEGGQIDPKSALAFALRQDPLLAGVRLLAPGSARFSDAVRGYWLRRGEGCEELKRRFIGSDSINSIAAHAGFTLADAVSYSRPHNEANSEHARGRADEPCANLGIEGPTDDRLVAAMRRRLRRAMMATLLFAQGKPMLCAGDEIGRTQGGNNHASEQDNATSWLDWESADPVFFQFVAEAAALRRAEPLLHYPGRLGAPGGNGPFLRWLEAPANGLACLLDSSFDFPAEGSARLLLLFNPGPQEISVNLPEGDWRLALDSSGLLHQRQGRLPPALAVPAHALVLLRPPAPDSNPLGKK
jgi:glycogen operon protein